MSETSGLEATLITADRKQKQYDWLGAAESYKKALGLVAEKDFSRMSEICEKLSYTCYRGAFQAESNDEFRERMRQAVVAYEKAKELYGKLNEPLKTPRILRCDAMIAYAAYWLKTEATEKKRLLDESWRLTKESLKAFEENEEAHEYGKTFSQLSLAVLLGFFLEWDFKNRQKTTNETIEHAEKTAKFFSTGSEAAELARAYVETAAYLQLSSLYFLGPDEKGRCLQKSGDYWRKATDFLKRQRSSNSCTLRELQV